MLEITDIIYLRIISVDSSINPSYSTSTQQSSISRRLLISQQIKPIEQTISGVMEDKCIVLENKSWLIFKSRDSTTAHTDLCHNCILSSSRVDKKSQQSFHESKTIHKYIVSHSLWSSLLLFSMMVIDDSWLVIATTLSTTSRSTSYSTTTLTLTSLLFLLPHQDQDCNGGFVILANRGG